ncbi:PREDICTED: uncharacterized protein LOC108783490 [Cyphomyrmex costatus]|uniref:uncharacterized protein LOC108783490 n=1 Tax=Cyphomyrmex costatus TaxID=456900 RepID=UPI0008523A13|nr:PREDICTED: uncharacterized protein LOC108783490 [Cyphomyrmex costatus]
MKIRWQAVIGIRISCADTPNSFYAPEQTSIHHVKAFCKTNVDMFFRNFGQLIDEHHFEVTHIYNMDETGFSTVATKLGKVIALKGTRHVGKLEAAERGTMITMALTVNAAGNSIPPFFLFPRKKMQTTFLDNVSFGTVAIDIAVSNGVHILSFPPHCSHKLQPLDVSVFGPVKTYYKSQCAAWQKNNANKVLEIRHVAGLVCKTLDLALTPKIIKSGFRATGIFPFNPDIFSVSDFVQAVRQNEIETACETRVDEVEQRRIVVLGSTIEREEVETGHEMGRKEVVFTTSEPSTSRISFEPLTSRASSLSSLSLLEEIGPLQAATPKKPSNRGRKPMQSAVITSPECIASLNEKATKTAAKQLTKQAVKRGRKATKRTKATLSKPSAKRIKAKESSPSDDDVDFCIICLDLLPRNLTAENSIKCNECSRSVHLKCAEMRASYFTCKHCASDEKSDE